MINTFRSGLIYKYILIDFGNYIPKEHLNHIQRVTLHTPPRLKDIFTGPFNSRMKFTEWIHSQIKLPTTLKCYKDTITFQYTITSKGKISNISILHYKSDITKVALETILKKSPRWIPAIADRINPINIVACDKIIINIDNNGNKSPFRNYENPVYCNTKTSPTDPNIIIFNPETKPIYKGKNTFLKDIIQELISDKTIQLNGSFIIEKDGSTSNIQLKNSIDTKTDSTVVETISRTKWTAATQGEKAVRTNFSFAINKRPAKKQQPKESDYDIYGKYFIALQASPARTPYAFTLGNGSIYKYPYNSQGIFDYSSYYRGLTHYYKYTPHTTGNISKKYFNKIYKLYTK